MAALGKIGSCACECGGGECSSIRVIGLARQAGLLPLNATYYAPGDPTEYTYVGHWPRGGEHPDSRILNTLSDGTNPISRESLAAEVRYLVLEKHRTWTERLVNTDGFGKPDIVDSGGVDETITWDEDSGVQCAWSRYSYCEHGSRTEAWTLNEDGSTTTSDTTTGTWEWHGLNWDIPNLTWSGDVTLTSVSATGSGEHDTTVLGLAYHAYQTIAGSWTFSGAYALSAWKDKAVGLLAEVGLSFAAGVTLHDMVHSSSTWTPTPGFSKSFVVWWQWGDGGPKHKCIRDLDSFYPGGTPIVGSGGVYASNGRMIEHATSSPSRWVLAVAVKSAKNYCSSYWSALEEWLGTTFRFDLTDTEFADVQPLGPTGETTSELGICAKGQTLLLQWDSESGRFAAFIDGSPPVRVYVTPYDAMAFVMNW